MVERSTSTDSGMDNNNDKQNAKPQDAPQLNQTEKHQRHGGQQTPLRDTKMMRTCP
ncbi:hypothetical protein [Rhodopirellula sp. MGV]|uniref:hypothetical protein n=1 Tax=Rhodopirellula sp. MGV TaxID=2023130 RepID=UPI00130434F3|nr:hypothetical protein [Rhodopirellula sp. MGV]